MKSRLLISVLVIALAAAMIGGGTMAWFTAKDDAPVNEFTAGTVMIQAGEEFVWGEDMDNVNPGDCFAKCIQVYNTGTKDIELRLEDVGFEVDIDWTDDGWLAENFAALCFGEDNYNDIGALETAYNNGEFENPAFIAPCPDSGWAMEYVKENGEIVGFNFYYTDGPIAPGDSVELCAVVAFDGELMNNVWQAADWKQINGVFEAVQASNNAPAEVWGAGWDWADGLSAAAALQQGTSTAYANYFYENGTFLFADCLIGAEYVTTQEELNAALDDEEIERIKLDGEFDGFILDRGVVIQGGTINAVKLSGEPRPTGIYLATEEDVSITGVTFDGEGTDLANGVLSVTGNSTKVTVENCVFKNVHMGVYFNPGAYGTISGNTFNNINHCAIGIDSAAGVEIFNNYINNASVGIEIFKPNVNYYDNTFVDVTTDVVE